MSSRLCGACLPWVLACGANNGEEANDEMAMATTTVEAEPAPAAEPESAAPSDPLNPSEPANPSEPEAPAPSGPQGTWSVYSAGSGGVLVSSYNDLWGTGPDNIYAAVDLGYLSHYNGSSWELIDTGVLQSTLAVWGTADGELFLSGSNGLLLQRVGAEFVALETPTSSDHVAVWASSASDIWIAGQYGFGTTRHFDGEAWQLSQEYTDPDPNLDGNVVDLWGSGPNDVYGVDSKGVVYHFQDGAWSIVTTPSTDSLWSLFGTGPNDVWAVGADVLHYDGASWQKIPVASQEYRLNSMLLRQDRFLGVWVSATGQVTAVGDRGSIWQGTSAGLSRVERLTEFALYAVWGSESGELWAVGENGVILRFTP